MCVFALQNRYYASSAASAKYNIYIYIYPLIQIIMIILSLAAGYHR